MAQRGMHFFAAACCILAFSSAAISAEETSSALSADPAYPRPEAESFSPSLVTVTINGLSVSGFVISDGLIVTSAAVFSGYSSAGGPPVRIQDLSSGEELQFKGIQALSFLSNLAVLKTASSPELKVFLDLGEDVSGGMHIPQASGKLLRQAEESRPQFVDGNVFYYFLSDSIAEESGQSGLPVLSEEGAVIGVVSRAYGNLFQAVSVRELQKLLSQKFSRKPAAEIIAQKIIGLNRLAKKRNLEALYRLALISPGARGDQYLQAAASHGHVRAQLYWGMKLIYESRGKEAVSILIRAARNGHPEAKTALAGALYRGEGLSPDEAAAFKLYRDAAREGHVTAQTMMGVMLLNGQGARQNEPLARSWLMAAAEKGDPLAGSLLSSQRPKPSNRQELRPPDERPPLSSRIPRRRRQSPNGSASSTSPDGFVFPEVSFKGEGGGAGGSAPKPAAAETCSPKLFRKMTDSLH